jgi:cytochrome b pre-mRNA-processing protein 3
MGTGDLSVGRQVKRMAQGFYGRIRAYERALEEDGAALGAALARNVFGTLGESAEASEHLACWMRRVMAGLAAQPAGDLCDGIVEFPPPVVAAMSAAAVAWEAPR